LFDLSMQSGECLKAEFGQSRVGAEGRASATTPRTESEGSRSMLNGRRVLSEKETLNRYSARGAEAPNCRAGIIPAPPEGPTECPRRALGEH